MLCCLQVAEGITRLHHWQSIIIPVPMLSSAARCFELFAVSSSLLHAHNPGCFLSVFRTVSCLYTTPIKVCVRRTCCMLGTTLPAGGYSTSLCKLQMTMVPHIDPEGIFRPTTSKSDIIPQRTTLCFLIEFQQMHEASSLLSTPMLPVFN